jgi:hypothetical protein
MDGSALAPRFGKAKLASRPRCSLGRREVVGDGKLFSAYLGKTIHQSHLYDTLVGLFAREAAPKVLCKRPASPGRSGHGGAPSAAHLPAEDNVVNQKPRCACCNRWLSRRPGIERHRGFERCSGRPTTSC